MADRFSCARTSLELEEPLTATASHVRRWVLVEQPGSWGHDALFESRLPTRVGEELLRRCREVGARALLIRRCGGLDEGTRRVFVASSAHGASWLERFDLDEAAEVLDVDLSGIGEEGVGGRRVGQPLLLTCTNGAHDPCCAEYGRVVARMLDGHLGERAWECSHIGGDRFAANVLALPHGVYYGRVPAEAAVGVARLHEQGLLSLPHYRGRSIWPFDVQAAETMLRVHLGADGIEDVVPRRRRRRDDGTVSVELTAHDERWRVELEVTSDPYPQQLTCAASRPAGPPRYALREVVTMPADVPGTAGSGGAR